MAESIVKMLLESSLAAAVGTAVVALMRLALRKAPRRWVCLMWAAVFFRCLCPAAPESPLSLFSAVEYFSGADASEAPENHIILEYTPSSGGAVQQNNVPLESTPNRRPTVYTILMCVWLAGTVAVLGYGVVSGVRLRRRVSAAVRTEKGVYESDRIDTAFTAGTRIYLPTGLTSADRELVLLHERAHLRAGDNLFKPLAFAGLAVQWYNPAVWLAFRLLSRDMEIAADEAVLRACGRRQDYARALLRASQLQSGIAIIPEFGNTTKERIEKIMDYKKPSKLVTVLAAAAALTACASVGTDPVSETYQTANPAAFDSFEDVNTEVNVYTTAETTAQSDTDAEYTADGLFEDMKALADGAEDVVNSSFDVAEGTEIRAVADGTASFDTLPGYGRSVFIDQGDDTKSVYAGLSEILVKEGDTVKAGDVIGCSGKSFCFQLWKSGAVVYLRTDPEDVTGTAARELNELKNQAELLEKEPEQSGEKVADSDAWKLVEKNQPEDEQAESAELYLICPVAGDPDITALYGERNQWTDYFHSGVDFKAEEGTEVYAAADGVVEAPDEDTEYGVNVVIDHGHGVETVYAHLSQAVVEEGDQVKQGDLIGYVGATGMAFGHHLHFEVRQDGTAVDPGFGSACGSTPNIQPENVNSTTQGDTVLELPGGSIDYIVYEPYGLLYDSQNGCYTFNGSIVRYFNDPVAGASFTNYFTGTVDLVAEYDTKNTLVGIKECSQEEYDYHTKKHNAFSAGGRTDTTIQNGTQSANTDWLKDYEIYGVFYDTKKSGWYCNGERIKILIDSEKALVYSTDENGICLSVVRNEDHTVAEIKEITETDAKDLIQKNNPQDNGNLTIEG